MQIKKENGQFIIALDSQDETETFLNLLHNGYNNLDKKSKRNKAENSQLEMAEVISISLQTEMEDPEDC